MALTYPYWNNDEVISSDKLNSMVQAIINGDPLAVKVSNATKNDVNQIVGYLSSLHDKAKTNLNSATSTSDLDSAYNNMTALVSNKLGAYANDATVDLYSTGIRSSIIAFLQAYDTMMSSDRLNNKNTDNTLGSRIDSETRDRENADNAINAKISDMQANGGGRNLLYDSSFNGDTKTFNAYWGCGGNTTWAFSNDKPITSVDSHRSLQFTPKSNLPNTDNGIWYTNPQVKAGEVYTFGFWGKSTSDGFKMEVESFSDLSIFTMTTAWKYYSGQLKFASDNRNMYFRISGDNSANTGTVTIFHPMLEKGTVAHDWQPAPEDTNSAIENVNAKADANTASISKITGNGGGRNIGYNTSDVWREVADTDHWNLVTVTFFNDAKAGETYTVSADIQSPTKKLVWQIWDGSAPGVRKNYIASANISAGTTRGHCTFTWPNDKTQYMVIQLMNEQSDSSHAGYSFRNVMLERGTVAHDWSPNPDEVQSQIDNLNANKISSSDVNWNLVANNSSNTYNYASGSKITLPNNSSIIINGDHITSHIYLPAYLTDYTPNTDLNALATSGECDNLFVSSATMGTLSNRPINPDTNASLTGDCFYTCYYAYSGTTVRAFQKIYSCDYNYTFTRSYNGSSQSWTNWSCLTPYA